MLLIHPPLAKNCEPPGGITRLAGVLRGHGFDCFVLDCSHEALSSLLQQKLTPQDTWSKRAYNNRERNIRALGLWQTYENRDRYRRCVTDINRTLELAGQPAQHSINLSNYNESERSPLKSQDLISAASQFKTNIFYSYFSKRLTQVIEQTKPGTVGFSLNYLSQALTTFAMIGFIKNRFPGISIIVGGGLITSWSRNQAWDNPFSGLIDHLISGQGEEPLLRILGWRGEIQHYPPDYSDLAHHTYFSPGFILPYASSTGCYWNKCSFCPEKTEKNPYSAIPTELVMKDLNTLVRQTKPILIHFLDNAVGPPLLSKIITKPPKTNWYGFVRFNQQFTDLEYCEALRQSGCVMLKLGLESGDQEVLDTLNKGIDLSLVSRALKNLKRAGIATYVYLLFGTPIETIAEARRTMKFVTDHSDAITYLNLAIFNLPIGSTEINTLSIRPFYEGDLSLYCNFIHPKNFDRKEVRRFLDQEFKRQPEIAKIVQRDPPLFTSNHAPLFHCSAPSKSR